MTVDELAAGASTGVDISFVIDADFVGTSITNTVEIAAADDDNNPDNIPPRDVDSTPDTDQSNDDPTDGDPSNDEDDHDDAMIEVGQEMDLAIDKRITTPAPYIPGQDITYTLTVINEGEVTAALIDLVDYFPSDALTLNDSNWTQTST